MAKIPPATVEMLDYLRGRAKTMPASAFGEPVIIRKRKPTEKVGGLKVVGPMPISLHRTVARGEGSGR